MPSMNTQQQRAERIARLQAELQAGTADEIGQLLKVLLAAFPSQDPGGEEGARLRLGAYVFAIAGIGLASLSEAVALIIRGKVPEISDAFAPTPTQLAKIARRQEESRLRFLDRLKREDAQRRALPAPERSPEEQARIDAKVAAAMSKLAAA